jgi:hypothetical protein
VILETRNFRAAVSTPAAAEHKARPALLVGALGVVFGDIGTSPIYEGLREDKPAGRHKGSSRGASAAGLKRRAYGGWYLSAEEALSRGLVAGLERSLPHRASQKLSPVWASKNLMLRAS